MACISGPMKTTPSDAWRNKKGREERVLQWTSLNIVHICTTSTVTLNFKQYIKSISEEEKQRSHCLHKSKLDQGKLAESYKIFLPDLSVASHEWEKGN